MNNDEIVFLRPDNTLAQNAVVRNYDQATGEVMFFELLGFSGDIKGGVYVDGKEMYKRLFIQRVHPAVEVTTEGKRITP